MKVYRPILTNYKTQGFAERKACIKVDAAGAVVEPMEVLTKRGDVCTSGYRDFYTTIGLSGHDGEDWASYNGEQCHFPVEIDGATWYSKSEKDPGGGIGVDIISKEKVTLNGRTDYLKFRFWHLKSVEVNDGDEIVFGQLIALCDSTGASSGHHVHFAMKWCTQAGVALDNTNGYKGAVDFTPWFENKSVFDVAGAKIQARLAIAKAHSIIAEARMFLKNFNA